MPRRSIHFVPGGQQKMLEKALTLPADGLILDLEDAVPPDRKTATRPIVREWLARDFGGRERWIRMNPISTELARDDLAETIDGIDDEDTIDSVKTEIAAQAQAIEDAWAALFAAADCPETP